MYRRLKTIRSGVVISRLNFSIRFALAFTVCSLALIGFAKFSPSSYSAAPASGTVSESNPMITWTGAIMPANPDVLNSPRCNGADDCDNFSINIVPPSAAYGPYVVEVRLQPQGDWDMEIYNPNGTYRTSSGNGVYAAEVVTLYNPPAGSYRIAAFPFAPVVGSDGNSYAASAELKHQPPSGSSPAASENVSYGNFPCPVGQTCTASFGEPSIGANWKSGNVMFAGGGFPLQTFRVSFNDQTSPSTATWTDVSGNEHLATSPRALSDPILFTDSRAGRTFAGQLEGLTPFETMEYTDDDGNLFVPSQGSGIASGVDHETLGGGPFAAPLTRDPNLPRPAYPNAVYYCAQALGPANCALSMDGGETFGPSVPMWTTECGGLHGHVKVAPNDGTVYVPNRGCGGRQGLAVSSDNGMTWAIRTIPGTGTGESDPSIGVATDGTVYFGFVDGDGHPKVAVTHDKGVSWDTLGGAKFIDVGIPFGIQNAVFAAVVAGDPQRAAFAFHGSPTAGPFQDASFNGVWDLYVATTFDGGATWATKKASPDPTQRGCIWLGGGDNPCRNLLDFMDATVDQQGRVIVGYADGCTGACATDPNNTAKSVWATIARQSDGKRMFAAFDPSGTPTPTPTATPTPTPSGGIYYLHGTAADEANKKQELTDPSYRGTATFDQTAPTGTAPITQTSQPVANEDFVGNSLAAYWRSPFHGTVNGNLELNFYWATPNADATAQGVDMVVTVFADPDYVADRVQTQHIIGRSTITLGALTPVPTLIQSQVPVNGTINGELLIQVTPAFINTGSGILTLYDSTTTPSNFKLNVSTGTPTPTPTPSPSVSPTATPTPVAGGPTYTNYYPPSGVAESWGEPSIGSNWVSGNVMFFGGINDYALRASFNDSTSPASVSWFQTPLLENLAPRAVGGDPILVTDKDTGRTFVSQLQAFTPSATMDITDDDGASYTPAAGFGIATGLDHQTIGVGPFHAPVPAGAVYKNAVYYCSQEGLNSGGNGIANCALSVNGGVSFGPAVPVYVINLVNSCFPLHGHAKVAPDGTVYLPNRKCGNGAGLVVSEDNGVTWNARTIPGSSVGDSDASVGIASDGSIYLGYEAADGHPRIAVSHDKGVTWINHTDVGAQLGLQNSVFPAVVAGDGGVDTGRAAYAFYGSTSPGDQDDPAFRGNWYLYISSTFDGGKTWTTVNATPNDPIQRDGICTRGFQGCTVPRNLLDFFDATIDKQGRVLVGYEDGCMGDCVTGGTNMNTEKGVIARQSGGRRMFSAYDNGDPSPSPSPTPTVTPTPIPTPSPIYQKGGIIFSPNVTTRTPVTGRDGEPSLRVDKFGNAYVAGIRGVPAGVDLWYFDLNPSSPTYDPFMRNPISRGQPDQFSPDESIEVGADGGGDVDLAVGFDEATPGKPPYLAFSSLTAANISTASSNDKGVTFTKNPAGNVTGGIPADDRQWMEFLGKDSVYLIYRTLEPAIALVQRSNDGGLTYGPAREVGTIGQVGGVSVDQNDGTVYIAGGNGVVAVGTPATAGAEPLTYTIHNVVSAGNAHLFFTVKAAKDGTVYVCYSDDHSVFIKYSKDKGNTWSPAVRVSDGPETATSIVPWMETGPTPGSIGVVWYGTTASSNNDNADWKAFFAQSLNATDVNPVFRQVELSDHFIHGSNISEQGLPVTPGSAPNRNLLDYFQIGFDPTGAAVVAYTDDHNDFDGNVYVTRQISGPGMKGTDVPAPIPGSALPQPTPAAANAPQVVDFAQDAKTGLLTVLPLNDPLDILSVKYTTEGTAANPILVATMKVSDLTVVPPLSNWRMNFTANAPDSRMSPIGDYSFGLSDRGDQFFVRATTDALGTPTFTFGTAVREHQHRGFVAYTDRGAADSGSFNSAAGTITIKVALSKLNATLAAGRTPLGPGSILAGLRAGTFTTGDDNAADRNDRAKSDVTRGGTQYAINSAPTAALTANPVSGAPPLAVTFNGSGSSDPDAGDTLSYTFDFGDGSAPVTQSTATVAHTYNQLGKFTASLTVKDQVGFTSNTATVEINVTNRPPTAALSATPTSGYAPLAVSFNGSGSSDPDTGDSIASYTFDFGDGVVTTQSGSTISHTYNAAGIYTAKLTVADNHGMVSTNNAQVQITANARPTTDCMEDDDARITYSDGWHNGTSTAASAGHFRWHSGKSPSHTAAVDFSIPANGTGVFSYRYGKSTKGGTAEVFIDGVSRGTINFKGSAGSDKSPEFASGGVAYEARYEGLSAGAHRFELRNMADSVFVDGFCLTVTVQAQPVTNPGGGAAAPAAVFTGSPTTGPGQSTSNDSSVNAGQESRNNVTLGTNARALSIVAETNGNLPVKLALVSPTGLTLQIVDAVNGVAVLTAPVSSGGIYTVKVINVNLGPVQVWTVATPTITR